MTARADALRDLIARLEGPNGSMAGWVEVCDAALGDRDLRLPFFDATQGSLDAVARLEAGLRERGWTQRLSPPDAKAGRPDLWWAGWIGPGAMKLGRSASVAPTEARARLLAVLRALLAEQPRDPA